MSKKLPLFVSFLFFVCLTNAQVGGDNVYEFLNLSPSARTTGLGGNLITVKDDDIALAFANPSVLNSTMHHQLSFNHNINVAGIGNGYVAYGYHFDEWKTTFQGGLKYISYGEFDAANEFGQQEGTFKASEYALTIGAGYQLYDKVSIGTNIKYIISQLESYTSNGLTGDIAAFYQDTSSRFSATLVLKNIGGQLTTYRAGNNEPIPYEVQFGISKRLRYLPFRLSIIVHNLQRWNILYDDPDAVDNTFFLGEEPTQTDEGNEFVQNLFRHFIFNGEFLLGKKDNFRMRIGYNHFQRSDLSVANFRNLAGFTMGLGLKINRFRIDYGRNFYHLAGSQNHFSISTNFREFKR